ncbi:MAG: UbiA family prenyltransferase [Kofleriaceae bacterium]
MKLSVVLRLGRVSNLPTVTSNVLAAVALAGGRAEWMPIALVCMAMSLMYVAGMFLNDAFDRTIDAVERPDRPIPSGQVDAASVFAAGFAMLVFGVLAVAVVVVLTGAGGWPVASAIGLAALIVFYNMHHKLNPFAPVVMGLCRVAVYTTAALATGGALGTPLLYGCGALLAYLIGLTYVAKQENLFKLTSLWPLAFMAVPFVIAPPHGHGPWAFAIYIFFLGWTLRCLKLAITRQIRPAVTGLIAGIALLDALFAIRLGHPVMAGVAVSAFLLTTIFQRKIPGT